MCAVSQETLSARSSVPRAQISRIENGKAIPTIATAVRLCAALGYPGQLHVVFPELIGTPSNNGAPGRDTERSVTTLPAGQGQHAPA